MKFDFDLKKLSEILDEHIEKGLAHEKPSSKIEAMEDQIMKSLSHDPFAPVEMSVDSPYHNPYKFVDGGFIPYAPEHWSREDAYTQQFYDTFVNYRKSFGALNALKDSVEDLISKGEPVPIGTVHTYRDGQKYKKVSEGKWTPMAGLETSKTREHLENKDPKHAASANAEMERHASQKLAIEAAIKRKEDQSNTVETAKREAMQAAVGHMKETVGKMGIKSPELDQHFKQAEEKYRTPTPGEDHQKKIQTVADKLNTKHKVKLDFTVDGHNYSHEFDVSAGTHSDASARAQDELKRKLPNAQVTKVHAETAREKVDPETKIKQQLEKKTKKLGKGQGRLVALSKEELDVTLKSGKYALMSAGKNPNHEQDKNLTDEQVAERHRKLHQELKESGYAFTKAVGHYGGKEDSFLVMIHDADKNEITKLGEKYNQDSVIVADGGKQEMIYTTGKNKGKAQHGEGLDPEAAKRDDFYTEVGTSDAGKVKFGLNFEDAIKALLDLSDLSKAFPDYTIEEFDEILFKGGLPIGTVHVWHGISYRKISEGKWEPEKKGKRSKKKEVESGSEHIKAIEEAIASKIEGDHKESKKESDSSDLPADKGKPDNRMGPPPPENKAFIKAGKEVSKDDSQKFIDAFKPDYVDMQGIGFELKMAGADAFSNRLKDADSLTKKMHEKYADRSLNTLTDAIGGRTLSTLENQKAIVDHMKANYDIVEVDDSVEKPRSSGYRAIHVLFRTSSGKIAEMQLKTHRMQVMSDFTHDTTYKIPDGSPLKSVEKEVKADSTGRSKNPEVANYLSQLSDYLHNLDMGGKYDEKKRPVEPELFKKVGMKFPWDKIEAINSGDLSMGAKIEDESKGKYKEFEGKEASSGEIKHFVVVRDKNQDTLEIREFDDFDSADKFAQHKAKTHKGGLPMGYAESKSEFLKVFSEYRPKEKPKGGGEKGVIGKTKLGEPIKANAIHSFDPDHPHFKKHPEDLKAAEVGYADQHGHRTMVHRIEGDHAIVSDGGLYSDYGHTNGERKIPVDALGASDEAMKQKIGPEHMNKIFKTKGAEMVSTKDIQSAERGVGEVNRSKGKALASIGGKYEPRDPLSVQKVKRKDGSHFYSLRDGNTTFSMLKKEGWDKFPVKVIGEVDESDLKPIPKHERKSKSSDKEKP